MALLDLTDVHTYYGQSHILEGVSFSVEEGDVVALLGRNGVGKTTTIRSILQLTPPRSGSITYRDTNLVGLETHEVANLGVGWIPEERRIFTQLSVEQNIRIAVPQDDPVESAVAEAFHTFPDLADFRDRDAGTLSGGQQQMLAIARGLAGDNEFLLVDEPSEGLAPLIVESVADALGRVAAETTMLIVEQNLPLALDLADTFYILDNGQVVEHGSTAAVTPTSERLTRHLTA